MRCCNNSYSDLRRLAYDSRNFIYSNKIIDSKREVVQPVVEPVTVQECRNELKIESSYDDSVIERLISEGRQFVEKYCSISIVNTDVSALVAINHSIELPFGPIASDAVVKDNTDSVITSGFDIKGFDHKRIYGYGEFNCSYSAGMTTVPDIIKGAIISYVVFFYEQRGDNIYTSSDIKAADCRMKCDMFKRETVF